MIDMKDFHVTNRNGWIPDPWSCFGTDENTGERPNLSKTYSKHNLYFIGCWMLNNKLDSRFNRGKYDYYAEVIKRFFPPLEECQKYNIKIIIHSMVEAEPWYGPEELEKACKSSGYNFNNIYWIANQRDHVPKERQLYMPFELINRAKRVQLDDLIFFKYYIDECGRDFFDKKWKNSGYDYDEDYARTFKKWLFHIKEDVGDRKSRFLCYNNAINPYRLASLSWIMKNNLDKYFSYSFVNSMNGENVPEEWWKNEGFGNHLELKEYADEHIFPKIPIYMEHDQWAIENNPYHNNLPVKIHYENSYCGLRSETNFHDSNISYSRITEKTIEGCVMQPTLILATPGSLALVRELGFKTFPQLFDESYDDIEEPAERFNAVMSEVKRVCELPKDELIDKVNQCRDNILHNQKVLFNVDVKKTFTDFLEKLV